MEFHELLGNFRIVTFSDTHNLHEGVILPKCDIAIFCGDLSGRGNKFEALHFFRWFSRQTQCKYKVMISGNHDICFDETHNGETHAHHWLEDFKKSFSNIIILHNNMVNIENVTIWGSPVTPWYHGNRWAFNMKKEDISKIWDMIPTNVDIVVTHGPAHGMRDVTFEGHNVGCPILKDTLINRVKPQFHLCGHIHESYGRDYEQGITFINSSIVNLEYERANIPIVFEVARIKKEAI